MMFEQSLASEKVTPATVIEMNSIEAIKQAIMAGVGVTVIPEIAVQAEFEEGRMVKVGWVDELETGILMIQHKDKWRSPALAMLLI
ncbi:MAG: substrate-binding domain-containing protein [Syntrophobacteraceae bacterium]